MTGTHELEIVRFITSWVTVIGANQHIVAEGTPERVLSDRELLIKANLIHPQLHQLGDPTPIV